LTNLGGRFIISLREIVLTHLQQASNRPEQRQIGLFARLERRLRLIVGRLLFDDEVGVAVAARQVHVLDDVLAEGVAGPHLGQLLLQQHHLLLQLLLVAGGGRARLLQVLHLLAQFVQRFALAGDHLETKMFHEEK